MYFMYLQFRDNCYKINKAYALAFNLGANNRLLFSRNKGTPKISFEYTNFKLTMYRNSIMQCFKIKPMHVFSIQKPYS